MNPCDRYQPWVRTSSGQSPADPYGLVPTSADYGEWLDVADLFIVLVEDNVDVYQTLAGATEWPAVAVALREQYDNLGNRYTTWPSGDLIRIAAALAVDAACKLGQLEDAIIQHGGEAAIPFKHQAKPPAPTPGVLDQAGETAGNLLNILLLGGLIWAWMETRE